ncbi:MAG: hypothetical protein JRH20_21020 [Deltaproteobacteria bacterium]|nr:hypothetical protein [Deltaproteobacteria bacterium]
MAHTTEVLERMVRDFFIVLKGLSPSIATNMASILGPRHSWDFEPGSLAEHALLKNLATEQIKMLRLERWRSVADAWRAVKSMDKLRLRVLPLPFLSERPCSIRQSGPERFSREAWFFINGIASDKEMLRLNGMYLAKLFQRPIELIYNPTQGPIADLLECVVGRTFDFVTSPAEYALERVSAALSNPEKDRVILMGHSQGGIIVASVVAGLIERFGGDRERLAKLEVYTFASACDNMQVDPELDTPERRVPHIEHFANTGDMIAKLGVLEERLPVAGKVYTLDKPGHLLNAHYLPEIETGRSYAWRDARGSLQRNARLYAYCDGNTPELLPIDVSGKDDDSQPAEAALASAASEAATHVSAG